MVLELDWNRNLTITAVRSRHISRTKLRFMITSWALISPRAPIVSRPVHGRLYYSTRVVVLRGHWPYLRFDHTHVHSGAQRRSMIGRMWIFAISCDINSISFSFQQAEARILDIQLWLCTLLCFCLDWIFLTYFCFPRYELFSHLLFSISTLTLPVSINLIRLLIAFSSKKFDFHIENKTKGPAELTRLQLFPLCHEQAVCWPLKLVPVIRYESTRLSACFMDVAVALKVFYLSFSMINLPWKWTFNSTRMDNRSSCK